MARGWPQLALNAWELNAWEGFLLHFYRLSELLGC